MLTARLSWQRLLWIRSVGAGSSVVADGCLSSFLDCAPLSERVRPFRHYCRRVGSNIQPSFCRIWSLWNDHYASFRERMYSPNRLDAPLLFYVACRNNVVRVSHFMSHRNGSTHWEENPLAVDQRHRRVIIIIRSRANCFAGYLHHEWHAYCESQLDALSSTC